MHQMATCCVSCLCLESSSLCVVKCSSTSRVLFAANAQCFVLLDQSQFLAGLRQQTSKRNRINRKSAQIVRNHVTAFTCSVALYHRCLVSPLHNKLFVSGLYTCMRSCCIVQRAGFFLGTGLGVWGRVCCLLLCKVLAGFPMI